MRMSCKSQTRLITRHTKGQENTVPDEDEKGILRTALVVQGMRICPPRRGHRFNPWSKRIPQAMEQLSPGITAHEAHRRSSRGSQQEKPPQREAGSQ